MLKGPAVNFRMTKELTKMGFFLFGREFLSNAPPPCRTELNPRSEWVYEFPITLRAPTTLTAADVGSVSKEDRESSN